MFKETERAGGKGDTQERSFRDPADGDLDLRVLKLAAKEEMRSLSSDQS